MTNRDELYANIAGIITTLYECKTDCPESYVYIALGMDIHKYEQVRDLMRSSDLITVDDHRISLTGAGRQLAIDINRALQPSGN